MIDLEATTDGILLPVQAQPKARRNGIVGVHGGRLKVAVTQAPEKGKANKALVKLLAAALGLKRSQIEIVKGQTSAQKTFRVTGLDHAELNRRLRRLLS